MKKRILQFRMTAMAVMMGLLLGVVGMMKGYAITIGDLNYSLNDNTLTASVTGHKNGTAATGTLIIPETVSYNGRTYTVTRVSAYAFCSCSNFTGTLIISNTVTFIGNSAFASCSGITSLVLGDSVTDIDDMAFSSCTSLSGNLVIPNSVTYIGNAAFSGCRNLYSLTIGNSVTTIGDYAFSNCWGCSIINTLPNSLTHIGYEAFHRTDWYWNQPDGILYLDNWCLGYIGNKPTGDLSIYEGTRGIGDEAFYNAEISAVVLPNSMLYIGNGAFSSCSNLSTVVLGDSIKTIGNGSFAGCPLVSINLPNTLLQIGELAFNGCYFTSIDLPNSLNTIGNYAFAATSLESISIPNSITTIQEGVFLQCQNLSSVYIPNSVTTIGSNAFCECTSLTTIDINSVTTVETMAFMGCTSLTEFTFPNSVVTIGDGVFSYCSNLTSVYFGNSVSYIEGRLFHRCPNVQQIIVAFDNPTYDSRDNCNAVINTSQNRLDVGCKTTVIPNTVTAIGSSAFWGCIQLDSIEIPNSVTEIQWDAFAECSGLVTVDLPDSLVSIYGGAFDGCSSLTTIEIPNSVIEMGANAFSRCNNLTSFTVPSAVTFMGNQIFDECYSLAYVNILNENPPTLGQYSYDIDFPTSNANFTIYVPYQSLETYKTASDWSTYESYIQPLYYTTIPGYGLNTGNWRFISSPLEVTTDPAIVENMITTTEYDLYQFNQSANDGEWQNYKANNFNLLNGHGYLYANKNDVNIIFKGDFNENDTKEIALAYDANATFAGWNLVGNPFPVSAYANRSYYVMNEEGTAIEPVAVSMETAIPVCTGVMVKADNTGETVTFSKTAPSGQNNQGVLQIAVAQANTRGNVVEDKAIVSFNATDHLEKFVFNKDNATLSIPQGGKDLAIANAEKEGEMPLNFKAAKNGEYTITVNPEAVEMDYLHLIDNMTGNDIDLLASPSYSFNAETTDYASRFRLVFSVCGDADGDNEDFAFVSNNDIIINDEGTVQVVDMAGRIIVSVDGRTRCIPTTGMTSGVYVLRLINGNDVKTQKIVVR